jgi:hypothetical protein
MILDIIDGDDWKVVYLDGHVEHAGHDIPDFVWSELVLKPITRVRRWQMDMYDMSPPDVFTADSDTLSNYGITLVESTVADSAEV